MNVRFQKHYFPLSFISIITGIIFFLVWKNKDFITLITDASGYIAIILIAVSLTIGPINLILKRKNPISSYFRRDLSLTGGIIALVHSFFGLFVHLRGHMWQYFLSLSGNKYSIRFDHFGLANFSGSISTILILVLILISNDYFLEKLKATKWKNIQRLSYLMFVFAVIHIFYYRLIRDNFTLFYWFYLPVIMIVLVFQITGLALNLKIGKQG